MLKDVTLKGRSLKLKRCDFKMLKFKLCPMFDLEIKSGAKIKMSKARSLKRRGLK